jgi:hypothetical protein
MIKKLAIMALLVHAAALAALGETKEGTCKLKPGAHFDKDLFTVRVGDKLKGTCKFYIAAVGEKVITADIQVVNTSKKAMHCQCYVAFFDEAGELIGCTERETLGEKGIAAGKSAPLAGGSIRLPADFLEKAVRYQIAFYESDEEIGKEQGPAADRERAKAAEPASSDQNAQGEQGPGSAMPQGQSQSGSPTAAVESPQQTNWYSAGPACRELEKIPSSRGIALSKFNHGAAPYAAILANSQPGATIILLFALDNADRNVPAEYMDLLPKPWAEVEAALQKGETVEVAGESRQRKIVLLAAPTTSKLKELIHNTKLLSPNPVNK